MVQLQTGTTQVSVKNDEKLKRIDLVKKLFDAAMNNWTEHFGSENQIREVNLMLSRFIGKVKHQRYHNQATVTRPLKLEMMAVKKDVLLNVISAWEVFCRSALTSELIDVVEECVAQIQGVVEFALRQQISNENV